jgi:hypothetical protein
VKFDDRTADVEAHAHAVGLGREQGGEQLFFEFWRDPRATIDDPDFHLLVHLAKLDRQSPLLGRGLAHRLDAVAHQIEQHLFEHHRVGQQFRAHALDLADDTHAAVLGSSLDEADAVVDDLGEIAGRELGLALANEVVHPPDDVAGALRLYREFSERLLELHGGEVAGFELVQAAGVVAGDRRQRLVQLMGQRRSHFAHGHQACGDLQFLLLLAGEFLGVLAGGDVDDRAHPAGLPPSASISGAS